MRLLAVPNWSHADKELLNRMRFIAEVAGVKIHYWQGDVDHQRSVTAFSEHYDTVLATMLELAELVKGEVNLDGHRGVHPRIGFLDVAPFVLLPAPGIESDLDWLVEVVRVWAKTYSRDLGIPVYLYERSAGENRPLSLAEYRSPKFVSEPLQPDFGSLPWPPRLGATVVGVRDFLLAVNIDLKTSDLRHAKKFAKRIRLARESGRPEFLGVRALGFELESRGLTQLSMNFTRSDGTGFDRVFEIVSEWVEKDQIEIDGTELIGVIRRVDLPKSKMLKVDPDQIVD